MRVDFPHPGNGDHGHLHDVSGGALHRGVHGHAFRVFHCHVREHIADGAPPEEGLRIAVLQAAP